MKDTWWGEDVVPRIRWRLALPDSICIGEGARIPDGYGIAYYDPNRPLAVCYPIPINLMIGAWRAILWHLQCPPWRFVEWKAERVRQRINDAHRDGYEQAAAQYRYELNAVRRQNAFLHTKLCETEMLAPRLLVIQDGLSPTDDRRHEKS